MTFVRINNTFYYKLHYKFFNKYFSLIKFLQFRTTFFTNFQSTIFQHSFLSTVVEMNFIHFYKRKRFTQITFILFEVCRNEFHLFVKFSNSKFVEMNFILFCRLSICIILQHSFSSFITFRY